MVEVINNLVRITAGVGIYLQDDYSETAPTNQALIHFNTIVIDGDARDSAPDIGADEVR